MTIAIMQPYLFPYLGYFQLIQCTDRFVLLDNVNYIKKGWINRNRILSNGRAHMFTIPLEKVSQNKNINQISIIKDNFWKIKLLKTISANYSKAPFYKNVFPLIGEIINNNESNLAEYIFRSLNLTLSYLGINTDIVFSSKAHETEELKGKERIMKICALERAGTYINPAGGKDLYSKELFQSNNIQLYFLKSEMVTYNQGKSELFIPNLSIIDVMMWNSTVSINDFLKRYSLV